jgi:hypothetical protein
LSASVIASSLGVHVSDVNGYLGIKVAAQAASPTPAPAVEAPESGSESASSTSANSGTGAVSSSQVQPAAAATTDTTVQAGATNALTGSSLTQSIGPALTPMDLTVLPGQG